MNQYHVVAITTKSYYRVASYEDKDEALKHILGRRVASCGVVLRDGHTGKRYTISEC